MILTIFFNNKVAAMLDTVNQVLNNNITLLIKTTGTEGKNNNTFIDSSTNALVLTRNGNITQGSKNPFSLVTGYSPSLHGGSAYFDGAGDYLTIPSNPVFAIGASQDFSIEAWVNFKTLAGTQTLFDLTSGYQLYKIPSGGINFVFQNVAVYASTSFITINTWNHVAVSRVAGTIRIFINGIISYTGTIGTNIVAKVTNTCGIGSTYAGANPVNGYISGLHVVIGSSQYSDNFTPSTTPPVAVANTKLLLNFTNAGIYDVSCKNDIETLGTAKISSAITKYNSTNIYFDGTPNSSLALASVNPIFNFGTSNFTIEFWYYKSVQQPAQARLFQLSNVNNYNGIIIHDNAGNLGLSLSSNGSTWDIANLVASPLTLNTWHHIALSRDGANFKLYVDGFRDINVNAGSTTSIHYNPAFIPSIGGITGMMITGYIEDFCITAGEAKYIANFTPPTAAL